jgi:integrase
MAALKTRKLSGGKVSYKVEWRQVETLDRELEGVIGGPVTIEGLTEDNISDWINWKKAQPRGGKPKTIANYHGLLYAIMESAKRKRLRQDNPCELIELPKADMDGDGEWEKIFLTKKQFALLASCVHPDTRPFITLLVATGLRFSEATALMVKDLHLDEPAPHLKVVRAWKRIGAAEHTPPNALRHPNGRFYMGGPKSKKSRRNITVAPSIVEILRSAAEGKRPEDLLFTNSVGKAIDHAHFGRDRWYKALDVAND